MALSRIWSAFILIAILVALISGLSHQNTGDMFTAMVTGKTADTIRFPGIAWEPPMAGAPSSQSLPDGYSVGTDGKGNFTYKLQGSDGIIETCKTAVNLSLGLIGIMALFMGFMAIAERAGGVRFLSRIIGPFFSRIFPEIPNGHPSMGHMMMNFSANLLGLDNAATPFGLKAMESLQELNPQKDTASNSQIMFLALHASGLTLIPVSIIALSLIHI